MTMARIEMPRLSDSMEEGTVVSWLVADGEQVTGGQEFVEIETDKAQMPFEAEQDGVLRQLVPAGTTLPVGAPLATIGEGGAPEEPVASAASSDDGRPAASPVARRIARELGVELAAVTGSGPGGRIVKEDVVRAAAAGAPAAAHPAAPSDAPAAVAAAAPDAAVVGAKGAVTRTPLSRVQQTVARRMAESRATVPDFSVSVDVDMEQALALRGALAERDVRFTVNDLLIRATAVALTRHPRVNGSYRDGQIETYARVNVGVAVAADDALVVPTVFDADRRTLTEIAAEVRRLAGAVRDGTITPPELAGGTFTISNLGMYGVAEFAGIVNQPQAAILCAGAIAARTMRLTLVSDHRILYGADAASFLAELRGLLETPATALA
ncbi:dihydrolipoamide acetyltransferase family protein [Conexibacter woesei]|uniref:Dihydrolipoamide acetyltransferase component of pyruvate dehydrogenase complex n=1 Tax=Conexibacter woesei (strain DSM 14684 / CCUG 47730 / CIP 108061 / JCM 11494 / NBRC 100937 / ID131577) TaxID=469383 RepID=D3F391_CONWI|nr:dihydrolipoamide acetyltransferase family protein [Conexibacter woesei]ADB50371.1 catalytic domain of components of various dehydrogenase complexes [Conexibacter woesei DSM 14684]